MDSTPMHPDGRAHVYQLLGCERCQTACPYNRNIAPVQGESFPLDGLLAGIYTHRIQELAGANMARPARILEQALVRAAETGHLGEQQLASLDVPPLLRDTAAWAQEHLKQHG